jgi:hypothetical protein
MHTHTLNASNARHREFLSENRRDSYTLSVFVEGNVIVFCGTRGCKSAHLADAWRVQSACPSCGGTETLAAFPDKQVFSGRIRSTNARNPNFVVKNAELQPPPSPAANVNRGSTPNTSHPRSEPTNRPRSEDERTFGILAACVVLILIVVGFSGLLDSNSSSRAVPSYAGPERATPTTASSAGSNVKDWGVEGVLERKMKVSMNDDRHQIVNEQEKLVSEPQGALQAMPQQNNVVSSSSQQVNQSRQPPEVYRPIYGSTSPSSSGQSPSYQPSPVPSISRFARARVTNVDPTDSLALRSFPDSHARKLADIPFNASSIDIIGDHQMNGPDIWVPVRWNGVSGWVHGSYIDYE